MKKLLFILFFLPLFGQAQNNVYTFNAADGTPMRRYDTTISGWIARVLVRQDHDYKPDSTEVIIDIPGLGEVGTDTSRLNDNGFGYWISNARWDGTVTLPSGNHHPIIIALIPSSQWPGESTIETRLDAILGRWKIKRRAVHVTGLSMGGWSWTTFITSDASSPYNRAFKITSIFESGGANPNENTPYPDLFDRFATVGARGTGGKLLSFEQDLDDSRDAISRVNRMNSNASGSYYIKTNFGTRGHSNFNDHYNPFETNWTTSNPEVTSTTPAGGISVSVAQWLLLQGDTTTTSSGGGSPTITANAGTDFWVAYDQGGAARTFSLSGSQTGASSPVYSWSALAGNPAAVTITSPSSSSTTVTGATTAGYYGFVFTVTESFDAEIQDTDTIYVHVRDLMQRGIRPCRVGQPQVFTIGDQLIPGRVTTTEIYMQYITRDNLLPDLMGGDILQVKANPNHANGWWNSIQMGDISGGPGCPIRIVPDSASGVTRVSAPAGGTRGWYFANADSNTMAHFILDGTYWHSRTGNWYGFQGDNSQYSYDSSDVITNSLNTGMAAQLIHHAEITGWYFNNVGHGFQFKKNSDSTKLFTIWNNFRQSNIHLHHNQVYKSNYEGVYGGHTDWDGSYQAGNDGRTIMLDSILVEKNIFFKTGLDGIQISNHGPGAIVRNNLVYQSGYRNGSSHRWSIFIGGNANGVMHGNTIINARGPAGALGYGTVRFYNNIIDSVNDGGNVESAMYINKSSWTGNTDSLKMFIEGNIISRVANTSNQSFVYVVNSAGLMGKGAIRNNTLVHPSKTTIGQMVTTNAGDTVTGNIILPAINLDTTALAQQESYRVYKELLLTNPPGTKISFRDLQPTAQPQRGFRVKGKRFKFKINQ